MISAVKLLEDPERMRNHCAMAKEYKAEVFCLIIDDLSVNLPIPLESDREQAKSRSQRIVGARNRLIGITTAHRFASFR